MDQRAPAPRAEVNCPVWIDRRDGSPLMSCTAVNLSRTGVKLAVAPNVALPNEFVVRFTPGGDLAMVCQVVWSRDGAIGLRFIARVGAEAEASA
jgi:hypothetical protein